MGQYYIAVLETNGKLVGYESKEPGHLKLTEHSWWYNGYVNAVAKMLFGEPHRIAWVGDYAYDSAPCTDEIYAAAWRENAVELDDETEFDLSGTFLVNHTKKEFINCDDFFDAVDGHSHLGDGWIMHPLSLITAIGNGQGGGDYFGINREKIGMWAWNEISIETVAPEGYTEIDVPVWYE